MDKIDVFYADPDAHQITIFVGTSAERKQIREYVRKYKNPKVIARTEYEGEVFIKCGRLDNNYDDNSCGVYTSINESKSDFDPPTGFFNMPGDSSVTCKSCGCVRNFCNERDSLRDMMKNGDVRLINFKATDNVLLVKEPFNYNKSYWKYSYRKYYSNK